jgi:hypothetical protein
MPDRRRFERELADLDLREHEVRPKPAPSKPRAPGLIILAAGVEYPRYGKKPEILKGKKWWVLSRREKGVTPERDPKAGSHWRQKCLALAAQRLRKDPALIVCLYDFDRATGENVTLEKGKTNTSISLTFKPLVDKDYRRVDGDFAKPATLVLKPLTSDPLPVSKFEARPSIRYCPAVSTIAAGDVKLADWLAKFEKSKRADLGLSIRDVYDHIEKVGALSPYTLRELHLFGHASSSAHSLLSGTAFVNTNHWWAKAERHPLDMDARAGLDFQPKTINGKNFRMAFAKGAMSYVWGCNWDIPLYRLFQNVQKKLGQQPLKDDARFPISWRGTREQLDALVKRAACSPVTWKGDAKSTATELTGKCVLAILRVMVRDTYMQKLADASAHCVTGGLPGTYSNYDSKSEKGEPKLLHIPMGSLYCAPTKEEPCNERYQDVMRFYARHLGISFNRDGADTEFGRGFALFCPSP